MKENYELMEHIYKDAEMAVYTLTTLTNDLKDKDNKIKKTLEDILKEYESWKKKSMKYLKKGKAEITDSGVMAKMMAKMGIKKEVINDNSDSSIAKMIINGVSTGSVDMEKKIKAYDKDVDKSDLKIAKEFLKFQEKTIDELKEYWRAFPVLRSALFENTSSEYCRLIVDDIKKAIKEHADVKNFESEFQTAFGDFDKYLYDELIAKMESLSISKTEEILSENIFARMSDIPLVDKYEAYQLLDDDWTKIAVDLEIIQTEGFSAAKVVDPNMVIKKKGNVEQEVQEGWKGHIIPFELIQSTILADDRKAIKEKENRLSEIASGYEEILDTLSEEEKEGDFVNEDSFVFAEIKKALKSDSIEPETKEKLKSVAALNTEEKALKSAIKTESALLEEKTKDTIEGLSDEQVIELLKEKWIKPLIDNLMQLPDSIVAELVAKLETLAKKYETTFAEVETQIEETEKSLSAMIDDLDGSEFDMLGLAELKKLLGGCAK